MTQQVDYKSAETIAIDPKLVRRMRWGVFLGIIACAIPMLYGMAIGLYFLEESLGRSILRDYLPEPPIVFWITMIPLVSSAWLLSKTTSPRSLLIFIEMVFARISLALLIIYLWRYREMRDLLEAFFSTLGLRFRHDTLFITMFVAWNMTLWAVIHLAIRNFWTLGLKRCSRLLLIWLAFALGWMVLVIVFYVANEYFDLYATPFAAYNMYVAVGLLLALVALFLMFEILAVMTSHALRRLTSSSNIQSHNPSRPLPPT